MERGELESLAMDLDSFMTHARANPIEFLSLGPLVQFMSEGNELRPGQLLNAYPPFIFKESADSVSLRAISMFDHLGFLADFAKQMEAVPQGTKVRIKVVNVPKREI
jgi:hypothetical protein